MANNTQLNIHTTDGDTIATLDVAGVKHEKVIVEFLDNLGNPVMVSDSNPLPTYNQNSTSLQFITATAGQTAFTFVGVPPSYSDYIFGANGGMLDPVFDFTAVGNVLTVIVPRDLNDRMRFQKING